MNRPLSLDYRVEPADYQTDFQDLRRVREPVYVVEQNVPIELEWDALDPLCFHVIARDADDRPIGTGRLTPEGKIGRMAVLREWRGRGVGEALLQALVDRARSVGWTEVQLNAQVGAIEFYARYGFVPFDDEFEEAGIAHQSMRRTLEPISNEDLRIVSPTRPVFMPVESLSQAIETSARLITTARREILIISRNLDPEILATPPVLDALRGYVTSGLGAVLRILLFDATTPHQRLHPWLRLSQRVSSAFNFRVVEEPTDLQYPSAFMVTDLDGVYFRTIGGRVEGEACDTAPARARQLRDLFGRMWEGARPCTEFRALEI
jgi:predicted GNAT family N-acyltransferase